jgi:hypothetical protein
VAAQRTTIKLLKATQKNKLLVMVNIIPLVITYTPEELAYLNVRKLNRWLKDALTRAGFKRVMLGSIDFSWESDRGVYQPHWHIAMWTSNPEELTRRLKNVFPSYADGNVSSRLSCDSNGYASELVEYNESEQATQEALFSNNDPYSYEDLYFSNAQLTEIDYSDSTSGLTTQSAYFNGGNYADEVVSWDPDGFSGSVSYFNTSTGELLETQTAPDGSAYYTTNYYYDGSAYADVIEEYNGQTGDIQLALSYKTSDGHLEQLCIMSRRRPETSHNFTCHGPTTAF